MKLSEDIETRYEKNRPFPQMQKWWIAEAKRLEQQIEKMTMCGNCPYYEDEHCNASHNRRLAVSAELGSAV